MDTISSVVEDHLRTYLDLKGIAYEHRIQS